MTAPDPTETTGFDADWLALRASADARARDSGLLATMIQELPRHPPLRILDLGAGTGNTMAALSPALPRKQHWRLVDADAALLDRVTPPTGVQAETATADLARDLKTVLAWRADLVTTSAFLDLAGEDWLRALAQALAEQRLPIYAALSYTGAEIWEPSHAADPAVLAAFHTDQRRDKGLGPALGPAAHARFVRVLRAEGYTVIEGASDWVLEAPRDTALIRELARGIGQAVAPALGDTATAWETARATAARVRIAHSDLLGLPPG
ncbi:MAG: class I SAM-dependent methyltransferase [Pseudomonadota bacterium]